MSSRVETLLDEIRAARRKLAAAGVSVEQMAATCGLHRNSILALNDPHWRPRTATVVALECLIARAGRDGEERRRPRRAA